MPKKRIAELHALERSPIAKKLWFFYPSEKYSSLVTVFPFFHTFKGASLSHKLLGNFLATFAIWSNFLATFAIWSNFLATFAILSNF